MTDFLPLQHETINPIKKTCKFKISSKSYGDSIKEHKRVMYATLNDSVVMQVIQQLFQYCKLSNLIQWSL